MPKKRGGKRPNAGRNSGWHFPKGTPLRVSMLPAPLLEAIREAKTRMTGTELIQTIEKAKP